MTHLCIGYTEWNIKLLEPGEACMSPDVTWNDERIVCYTCFASLMEVIRQTLKR